MKCDRCGYDDNGTGDFAHACSVQYAAPLPPTAIKEPATNESAGGLDSPWISVAERLPKKYEEVMVWPHPTEFCLTGQLNDVVWQYCEYSQWGNVWTRFNPTYWMPLPAAPNDSEG